MRRWPLSAPSGLRALNSVDTWLDIYAELGREHADQIRRALRGED